MRSKRRSTSTATTSPGRHSHERSGREPANPSRDGPASNGAGAERPGAQHRERGSMTDDVLVLGGPRPLRGRVRVPGDKGMSHRALLFAAMADGRSRVGGLATGDDVDRMRVALQQLGVAVTVEDDAVIVVGRGVETLAE